MNIENTRIVWCKMDESVGLEEGVLQTKCSGSGDFGIKLAPKNPRQTCTPMKLAIGTSLILLSVIMMMTLDHERFTHLVEWLQEHEKESIVLFVLFGALATTLLFPGTLLCLAAGASYGVVQGGILYWIANLLGQTLAFIVGRYVLRDLVVHYAIQRVPNFQAIDAALSKDGWKLIFLLRLSPVVPYNLLNYALATTGIDLMQFSVASALGVLPWVLVFAYAGAMARNAVAIGSKNFTSLQVLEMGPWYIVSWLALGLLTIVAVGVYTKKAIDRVLSQAKDSTQDPESPAP